jgi:AraC-like DNA-binding protein
MTPLPPDQIQVSNVRPAAEASLARGLQRRDLEAIGLSAEVLADPDGSVTGDATYAHFEAMERLGDYAGFVADATERHGVASLGVVGLACRTLTTVGEALACHHRFQHITNRTARYSSSVEGQHLVLAEERWGTPRPGLLLVSEYTLVVAVRLLSLAAGRPVAVVELRSRRPTVPAAERAAIEALVGAPLRAGADQARLVLEGSVVGLPVEGADPDLAAYFEGVLSKAASFSANESALLSRIRASIQRSLATATPTLGHVGRDLAMSPRTLQRRLQEEGLSFADLLADTRRQLALGYLSDDALSLAEVAWLLGYREETSFFRAFRRWTGTTPTAWRAQAGRT